MPDPSQSANELLPEAPGWTYGDVLPLARGPQGQLSLAVPGFLRGAVNDLGLALTVPGRVASGAMSLQQAAPLVPRMALGLAGLGAGGEAPEGALRIFAGRTAKTADTAALAKAMNLESLGHPPEAIWNSTGWMRGPDGQWRFEIPDVGARLNAIDQKGLGTLVESSKLDPNKYYASFAFPAGAEPTLGDVIEHPELFKAYPELAQTPVRAMPLMDQIGGTLGAVSGGKLYMSPAQPPDFLSTMLHEMQHVVQGKESFARGGSSSEFLPPDFANAFAAASAKEKAATARLDEVGVNPYTLKWSFDIPEEKRLPHQKEAWAKFWAHFGPEEGANILLDMRDAEQELKPLRELQSEAYNSYRNLAGEVEARNVQERHASGETGYPPATPGYTPFEQQIVKFDHEGNAIPTHRLIPVEHDPFNAVPVDYDPFAQESTK